MRANEGNEGNRRKQVVSDETRVLVTVDEMRVVGRVIVDEDVGVVGRAQNILLCSRRA